jgi:hypothetical protein
MVLMHCSLLRGVAFREPRVWSSDIVLVVVVLLLLGLEHRSGSFIFIVSFSFFGFVHPYYY